MKKYLQERFDVINLNTGIKLCETAGIDDALMMVAFDPVNRAYRRNQIFMGGVVDVEVPKQLPTNEVIRSVVQPEPLRLVEDERLPIEIN